jgi:S1-C subfamily serine protease
LRLKPGINREFPTVELAQSSDLPRGTPVAVMGYPGQTGVLHIYPDTVRGTGELVRYNHGAILSSRAAYQRVVATCGSLSPGTSGGPLVDIATNKVIGVNTNGYLLKPENMDFRIASESQGELAAVVEYLHKLLNAA